MEKKISWKYGLFVLLIIFILRLPSFWIPILDVDKTQYEGYFHALLENGIHYLNPITVHIIIALFVALTAYFCYRIAKKLYSPRGGLLAAVFYAIFTTTFTSKSINTSIVILMMLPLTMSIDVFLSWEHTKKERYLWLSGLLCGLACLVTYQAGINLVVIAAYLLFFHPLYLEHKIAKMKLRALLIFIAGGAIAGAVFLTYIVSIGAWDSLIFWNLNGSMAYVETNRSLPYFWSTMAIRGGAVIASSILVWYFAIRRSGHMISDLFRSSRYRQLCCEEYLILIWFLFSIIPVFTGSQFYGHYFLQLYPALCILAAGSSLRFFAWLNKGNITRFKQIAYSLFVVGLLVPPLFTLAIRGYYTFYHSIRL